MDPSSDERPEGASGTTDGAGAPPPPPPPPSDPPPGGSPPPGPPPPGGSSTWPPAALRRRTDDKIIAGVAGGLAAYLRVDPALVRIGFVVLLFMGGIGIPLYIAAWLLIPAADEAETEASELVDQRGPAFWVGVGLLVLVAFAVADEVVFAGRTSYWPLVLIAAGIALWRVGQKDGQRRAAAAAPPGVAPAADAATTEPSTTSAPSDAARAQEGAMSTTTTAVREYTPPPPPTRRREPVGYTPPPEPPRPRSILGRLTIALAFIAAGVTVVLDRLSPAVDAGFAEVAAVVLITIGVGLVVGTWLGRARWLILVGLLLTPVVIVSGIVTRFDIPFGSGIGERFVEISSPADVDLAQLDLAIGSLIIDLSEYEAELPGDPIVADVGAGEIIVYVPPDADVTLFADVGVGELVFFDRRLDGPDISGEYRREGDGPPIELRLDAGAGSLRVVDADGDITGTTTIVGGDARRGPADATTTTEVQP